MLAWFLQLITFYCSRACIKSVESSIMKLMSNHQSVFVMWCTDGPRLPNNHMKIFYTTTIYLFMLKFGWITVCSRIFLHLLLWQSTWPSPWMMYSAACVICSLASRENLRYCILVRQGLSWQHFRHTGGCFFILQ